MPIKELLSFDDIALLSVILNSSIHDIYEHTNNYISSYNYKIEQINTYLKLNKIMKNYNN